MNQQPRNKKTVVQRARNGLAAALLLGTSVFAGFSVTTLTSASANNDSYCGHGTGHIAYHQWHTYRWRNIWASHATPPGYSGHWNYYVKKRQPTPYPQQGLGWLWFDGGAIYKGGGGCV